MTVNKGCIMSGVRVLVGTRKGAFILSSDGKPSGHTSIENPPTRNPGGLLGPATAWLAYQPRGNPIAAAAFTGPHPELVSNTNWPGSATK